MPGNRLETHEVLRHHLPHDAEATAAGDDAGIRRQLAGDLTLRMADLANAELDRAVEVLLKE